MFLICLLLPIVAHGRDGQQRETDMRYRVRPRKHLRNRINKLTSQQRYALGYGVDLPSFAFDYSEYFVSAVIERSSESDDLYLNMFLVGHRAIVTDYPFDAISTEE
jgi:hypothetical protein